MIELGGKKYKLCLLDSNILSEMMKYPKVYFKNALNMFHPSDNIFCFSPFVISEIKRHKIVFDNFVEYFSIFPAYFVKGYEQLFEAEINQYTSGAKVSPILFSLYEIKLPGDMTKKDALTKLFDNDTFRNIEEKWNLEKQNILDGIISLVENYPPEEGKYTSEMVRQFILIAGFQQIAMRDPKFAKEYINNSNILQTIDKFPSVKMMMYTTFYKYYVDNRKPILSDVFDIVISALLPYVDIFITERHQAEVIRKTKARDEFINNLEVYTLRELR